MELANGAALLATSNRESGSLIIISLFQKYSSHNFWDSIQLYYCSTTRRHFAQQTPVPFHFARPQMNLPSAPPSSTWARQIQTGQIDFVLVMDFNDGVIITN